MLINEIKCSTALYAVFFFFFISLSLFHNDVVVFLGLSFWLDFIFVCMRFFNKIVFPSPADQIVSYLIQIIDL